MLSQKIHNLKYRSSKTSCCKEIEIRKPEFMAKAKIPLFSILNISVTKGWNSRKRIQGGGQ